MAKRTKRRAKFRELTYRTRPEDIRYVKEMAERLIGLQVVIRLQAGEGSWKRALLVAVNGERDTFRVRWSKRSKARTLRGVWRVHNARLFTETLLPEPNGPAKVTVESNPYNNPRRVNHMATRAAGSRKTAAKSTGRAKRTVKPEPDENGGGRVDKLAHLTEGQRKKAAAFILKERSKGTGWPDIMEELEERDLPIPGSMTGRRLLRMFYSDEELADAIRERGTGNGDATKKKAVKKTSSRKRKLEEEPEDEFEDDEEEFEDDEEEEDEPPRRRRRNVRVKAGSGRKANPSR